MSNIDNVLVVEMTDAEFLADEFEVGDRVNLVKTPGAFGDRTIMAVAPLGQYEVIERERHPDRNNWLRCKVKRLS